MGERGSVRENKGGKERLWDGRERLKVGDGRERKCERLSRGGREGMGWKREIESRRWEREEV